MSETRPNVEGNNPISSVLNCDCMTFMATCEDKRFNLAIVDPPYGLNWTDEINYIPERAIKQAGRNYKIHTPKQWDSLKPDATYFDELFRISENQIICGGNYYTDMLPVTRAWVVWDKIQDNFTCINNELLWTSFDCKIKNFRRYHGMDKGFMDKTGYAHIHPTQKPVALYKWLLKNYAKPGDTIFDSLMGSQSSRIATYEMGFDFYGCELDPDYFRDANRRFEDFRIKWDARGEISSNGQKTITLF